MGPPLATTKTESNRMRIRFEDFDKSQFSLHKHPVLVLEDFWSPEEMAVFRKAMQRSHWVHRESMPDTAKTFPGCGNWLKANMEDPERSSFIQRVMMPFVSDFMLSFDDVVGHVMSFNYFSYAMGDCLSLHSDERAEESADPGRNIVRRVALATYFHEIWDLNWGGELILYDEKTSASEDLAFEVGTCIPPEPGSLVLFTVPRMHRVCRVDPFAADNKRLSIGGWFMTEHR